MTNKYEFVCMMMESIISPPRPMTFPCYMERVASKMGNVLCPSSSLR